MSSPGDWMCGACQHTNFKKRDSCQRCGYSKYGEPIDVPPNIVRAGDWYCDAMHHNYARRTSCYICGAAKNEYAGGYDGGALPGGLPGDWICTRPGCSGHNYANKMECYKCKTPRVYYGGAV